MNHMRALTVAAALLMTIAGHEPVTAQSGQLLLSYAPPMRGAPATRLGGGTRGSSDAPNALGVLAPDHTGYTTRGEPSLAWFSGEPTTVSVEITIVDPNAIDPVLEVTLAPPLEAGIHALELAAHGVTLSPEREYQWFVALVLDPSQRSKDVVAGGTIRRVAESAELRTQLASARGIDRAAAYATAGIWYDAIAELNALETASPGDPRPREARATLLEQVGLEEIARHDRSAGR